MILKILKLPKNSERHVVTNIPVFMDPPDTELVGLGNECGFTMQKANPFSQFRIHEMIGNHLFIHDLMQLDGEFFPISSKWRHNHGVTKKIYTDSIFDLLVESDSNEVGYYQDLPITPFNAIKNNLETYVRLLELQDTKGSLISKRWNHRYVPELYLLMEQLPESFGSYKNNPKREGFLDSSNMLPRVSYVIKHLKNMIIPSDHGKTRMVDNHLVDEMVNILTNIKFDRLPFEENFSIFDPELDKLINDIGIYYPEKDLAIKNTNIDLSKEDLVLFNFPVLDFLKYCDLLLPETCEIVFHENKCLKFTMNDELYSIFWKGFPKFYENSVRYDLDMAPKIEKAYQGLLGDLLGLMRYKTGLNVRQFPTVIVKKEEGVLLTLTFKTKDGRSMTTKWDLTMLTIGAPEQYGINDIVK